jgi:hypothetical protein
MFEEDRPCLATDRDLEIVYNKRDIDIVNKSIVIDDIKKDPDDLYNEFIEKLCKIHDKLVEFCNLWNIPMLQNSMPFELLELVS